MRKKFLQKTLNIFLTITLISVSVKFGLEHFCWIRINESVKSYAQTSIEKRPIPNKLYVMSKHFPDIITYLALTSNYNRNIEIETGPLYPTISRDAAELTPSTRTYCMYAESLASQERYEDACELYRKASEMVPLKLTPKLGILQCQISQSETESAIETAEQILSVPIKIRSRRSIEIIAYTKHLADSLKREIYSNLL